MKKRLSSKSKIKAPSKYYIRNGLMGLALLLAIGFIIKNLFIIFERKYTIEQEKQALTKQVTRIKQDSVSLEQIKDYISSSAYQEKEAKQKLDLKKPGEQVVLITPGSITANLNDQDLVSILRDPQAEKRLPAQTNPERWWAFFFDKERL
jgi:cell division protein FtsB